VKSAHDIIQLRQVLAERFPQVRTWNEEQPAPTAACWPAGLPTLDALLQGGLPKGAITEIVSSKSGRGSATLLCALLRQAHQSRLHAALIDGLDTFDPAALSQSVLSRLLWVRCHDAAEAVKAADIILRDRNLPLVALDLKMNSTAQLRKVSPTAWYRLQRLAQQGGSILAVFTPSPTVGCADARLNLESRFTLADLGRAPSDLALDLKFDLTRWTLGANPALESSAARAG
jgi:hypothetical protein